MKRTELVKEIARLTGLSQKKAAESLDALVYVVKDEVKKGGEVAVGDLVKFSSVDRPERTYPNPMGGSPVVKPAHRAMTAKLLSGAKKALEN